MSLWVENALHGHGGSSDLYQTQVLVRIPTESLHARQGRLIEVLLEIQPLAIVASGGFHLIDAMSSRFASYANDFALLEGLRLAWLLYVC